MKQFEASIFLVPCDKEEVIKYSNSLSDSKSTGPDEVQVKVIKESILITAQHISDMINECFLVGKFPDELKVAKITPVFKKGCNKEYVNYRLISVLNVFSKLYEKAINSRLMKFLETQKILSSKQFGFRKSRSPWMAVNSLIEKVLSAWKDKEECLSLFIDVSKAFDAIDHDILLSKLFSIGVRGKVHDLLSSYLKGRKHHVFYKGQTSKFHQVTSGVPQGSILGPTLFIIYINDLASLHPDLNTVLFADDTSFTFTAVNSTVMEKQLSTFLPLIENWFFENRLQLNAGKSNYIHFKQRESKSTVEYKLKFYGEKINKVSTTKFLGLHIDSNLSWKVQLQAVSGKLAHMTGVFAKLRKSLPLYILKGLYNSFVLPHLSYGLCLWGSSDLSKVSSYQNRIVRSILGKASSCHSTPLYSELGVLKIQDLFTHVVCKICYKAIYEFLPLDHKLTLHPHISPHDTRSKSFGKIGLSQNCHYKSFWSKCRELWNASSYNLRLAKVKLPSYSRLSKSELLSNYKKFQCDNAVCYLCDRIRLLRCVAPVVDLGPHLFKSLHR